MNDIDYTPVAEAQAIYRAALERVEDARLAIKQARREEEEALNAQHEAYVKVQQAQAAASAGALEPGTIVRHRTFEDATGIVVESDGTGISVAQHIGDGTFDKISHGHNADEWVPVAHARHMTHDNCTGCRREAHVAFDLARLTGSRGANSSTEGTSRGAARGEHAASVTRLA